MSAPVHCFAMMDKVKATHNSASAVNRNVTFKNFLVFISNTPVSFLNVLFKNPQKSGLERAALKPVFFVVSIVKFIGKGFENDKSG